jgi:Sulfotransferase domain
MFEHLIAGAKRAFGLHRPGRDLEVLPDDIFLVSYPKSGNTWTRFLIANLVYPDRHPDFANINELVPDPEALSKRHLNQLPRPRILKSHQYFDPRYQRIIYVVRDPRDVVLSEFHFDIKRRAIAEDYAIASFVSRFVQGTGNHPYGTWGENVASWLYTRGGRPQFLLVRYEDLQSHGKQEMGRVARFLGIPADEKQMAFAIERSSAEQMRELEKKQGHLWSSTKETRQDKPFVRRAQAGGWKEELPEVCVAEIESAWGELMRHFGYEPVAISAANVSATMATTVNQSLKSPGRETGRF